MTRSTLASVSVNQLVAFGPALHALTLGCKYAQSLSPSPLLSNTLDLISSAPSVSDPKAT
eukprot:178492-Hanusia_phi.AAC.3